MSLWLYVIVFCTLYHFWSIFYGCLMIQVRKWWFRVYLLTRMWQKCHFWAKTRSNMTKNWSKMAKNHEKISKKSLFVSKNWVVTQILENARREVVKLALVKSFLDFYHKRRGLATGSPLFSANQASDKSYSEPIQKWPKTGPKLRKIMKKLDRREFVK